MKKILLLATGVVALAISGAALATTPGYFVGAQLGYSNVKLKTGDTGLSTSDKSGLGYGVFTGYNFNQYLGLQLGINKYNNAKYKSGSSTEKVKPYDIDLLVNGYLPLNDQFELFAKGGMAYVKMKYSGDNLSGNSSYHRYRPMLVLGAKYDMNKNVSFNLSYSRIFKKGSSPSSSKYIPTMDAAMVGVVYTFPNEM